MTMRLPTGGLIDRMQPLSFRFDGRPMTGFQGDSVASALMANGVTVIARSFKYHRPRGFFGAGSEEPNAVVTIGTGAWAEPNLVATQIPLRDGMVVTSQNRWPSLKWDVGALNGLISPLLPSGFYYKTFMWPKWAWKYYEHIIRNAAGFGVSPVQSDPDTYSKRYRHCDVLVIGTGRAGLTAAREAARSGARVILCDEGTRPGGRLLDDNTIIDGQSGEHWAANMSEEMRSMPDVELLYATTVFGWYDHNYLLAVTRNNDVGGGCRDHQTLQKIRARKVILATGAIERSLLFEGNDRPGIMLCSAVRRYINRYGVKPGSRAVVYVNNDSGYQTLEALRSAGIEINAVIDRRCGPSQEALNIAARHGIQVLTGSRISSTRGRNRIRSVSVSSIGANGRSRNYPCDVLCVSGGWTPSTHLFSQAGGEVKFDSETATLMPIPGTGPECDVVGAAAGRPAHGAIAADWSEASNDTRRSKVFVDLQNDVTVADLGLAVREGYADVELAKRYTTTGMGTDQGKTSNVHAIGLLAELSGKPPQDVGHTTYRPPYTPVTLGAVAGRDTGDNLASFHRTPFHHKHMEAGCIFEPSSTWLYPKCYPRGDETIDEAVTREVLNTRSNVGMVDMSTLGKIEVCGPDAVRFLELAYINRFARLAVGRCRYGIMLRHDGMVLDDGTVTRISDDRYLITMTTAQSWPVQLHLERLVEVDFPELDVCLLPVTEQWASLAVAGPRARQVLQELSPDFDVSNDAFPFTHYREGRLAGLAVRVFRVSFSGELSYEINVGANTATALWDAVMEAGREFSIMPYGVEALDVMRVEKGHLSIGAEIDGQTTPGDLGLDRMIKPDGFFVGQALLAREGLQSADRLQLVGLRPTDRSRVIPRGAVIIDGNRSAMDKDVLGHVTATVFSPTIGEPVALALVANGRQRGVGERLFADSPVAAQTIEVEICSPVFVDLEREKLRA